MKETTEERFNVHDRVEDGRRYLIDWCKPYNIDQHNMSIKDIEKFIKAHNPNYLGSVLVEDNWQMEFKSPNREHHVVMHGSQKSQSELLIQEVVRICRETKS